MFMLVLLLNPGKQVCIEDLDCVTCLPASMQIIQPGVENTTTRFRNPVNARGTQCCIGGSGNWKGV